MAKLIIIVSALIIVVYSKRLGSPQYNTNGLCLYNNKSYNPGQQWFSSDCKKWTCLKGNCDNEMILEEQSCDYHNYTGRRCETKIIPEKNYPECCSLEVVCDEDLPNNKIDGSVRVERSAENSNQATGRKGLHAGTRDPYGTAPHAHNYWREEARDRREDARYHRERERERRERERDRRERHEHHHHHHHHHGR